VTKHARNFGTTSDEIFELTPLLKQATELAVDLHVNWDEREPHLWELEFIKNAGAMPGNGGIVLRQLIEAADQHQKCILGFAQNLADCRLPPDDRLLSWYEKHGFVQVGAERHGVQIKRPCKT